MIIRKKYNKKDDLTEKVSESGDGINLNETKEIIVKNETYKNNTPSGPEDTIVSNMIRRYTAVHGLPNGYNPY